MEMEMDRKHQETLIKILHKALEEESKNSDSKKKDEIYDILIHVRALQIRFRGTYKTDCPLPKPKYSDSELFGFGPGLSHFND